MKLIIQKYNPKFFFIGYDNKFGYKRKGSYEYFSKNIIYNKITFKTLNPFIFNNKEVKSSLIKDKIAAGDIREANKLLGYKYKIIGNFILSTCCFEERFHVSDYGSNTCFRFNVLFSNIIPW